MNRFKISGLLGCLLLVAANCSTYRMSEQKQKEITAGPHGLLALKMPNGKQLDGYDEKWRMVIRVDKNEVFKDDLADDEVYTFPIQAGEREVNILLKRGVLRPFRMSYHYEYGNIYLDEKIKIEEGKTTLVKFETPERKVSVGLIILGVIVPIVPLIGWPIGDWPASYSDMKPVFSETANAGVTKVPEASKQEPPKRKKR